MRPISKFESKYEEGRKGEGFITRSRLSLIFSQTFKILFFKLRTTKWKYIGKMEKQSGNPLKQEAQTLMVPNSLTTGWNFLVNQIENSGLFQTSQCQMKKNLTRNMANLPLSPKTSSSMKKTSYWRSDLSLCLWCGPWTCRLLIVLKLITENKSENELFWCNCTLLFLPTFLPRAQLM